jgi:hypothetical protein
MRVRFASEIPIDRSIPAADITRRVFARDLHIVPPVLFSPFTAMRVFFLVHWQSF